MKQFTTIVGIFVLPTAVLFSACSKSPTASMEPQASAPAAPVADMTIKPPDPKENPLLDKWTSAGRYSNNPTPPNIEFTEKEAIVGPNKERHHATYVVSDQKVSATMDDGPVKYCHLKSLNELLCDKFDKLKRVE